MRALFLSLLTSSLLVGIACDKTPEDTGDADLDDDGYTEAEGDCDDSNSAIRPGALEQCDGVDNDCDGEIDEGDASNAVEAYRDADGDGYGDANDAITACQIPSGYSVNPNDCDDSNADANPGMLEDCETEFDDDCNGSNNEENVENCTGLAEDLDGDGAGGAPVGLCYCDDYDVYVANEDDCDDNDAELNPNAEEIWYDGIDQNCDGNDADQDEDGFDAESAGGDDCDDLDAREGPGAMDYWGDGVDNNCDGEDSAAMALSNWSRSLIGVLDGSYYVRQGQAITGCDFDEDGIGDLVTGSPFGDGYSGEVEIWYGSDRDTWEGYRHGASDAGTRIVGGYLKLIGGTLTCGDFNGDGHDDLAVGRSEAPFYTEFSILYFYGDGNRWAEEIDENEASADMELGADPEEWDFVYHPIHALDLDGDGADEIVVDWGAADGTEYEGGYRIIVVDSGEYEGQDLQLEEVADYIMTPSSFDGKTGVTPLDDLDGDGGDDFAALYANWNIDPIYGAIEFMGDVSSASQEIYTGAALYGSGYGTADEPYFGYNAVTGHFDGDGAIDLIVSSGGQLGAFYIFFDAQSHLADAYLSPDDADVIVEAVDRGALSGFELKNADDWTGDGIDDVWMVELRGGSRGTGQLWLLDGAALASAATIEDAAVLAWEGESSSDDDFARGISVLPDMDGDGVKDFALGYPYWNEDIGISYIFFSSDL